MKISQLYYRQSMNFSAYSLFYHSPYVRQRYDSVVPELYSFMDDELKPLWQKICCFSYTLTSKYINDILIRTFL